MLCQMRAAEAQSTFLPKSQLNMTPSNSVHTVGLCVLHPSLLWGTSFVSIAWHVSCGHADCVCLRSILRISTMQRGAYHGTLRYWVHTRSTPIITTMYLFLCHADLGKSQKESGHTPRHRSMGDVHGVTPLPRH